MTHEAENGTWTLISPSGEKFKAENPIKCVRAESEKRIPFKVRMDRLSNFLDEDDWIELKDGKPGTNQFCIVAACGVAVYAALKWNGNEFLWAEELNLPHNVDPFSSELATHWQPWPEDPK